MLARKRKQWCQEITAAPQPGFAHDLSSGTIYDSLFWWVYTAGSPHLEGLSHQQQCSSKTREPDFPDGHQEGRLCTCGRQSLTKPFETRMLYEAELCVCRKAPYSWYLYFIVGLEWPYHGPAWAAETRVPPAECYSQIHAGKQLCKFCLNLARLQTKIHHSFQDVSRPLQNNYSLHSFHQFKMQQTLYSLKSDIPCTVLFEFALVSPC